MDSWYDEMTQIIIYSVMLIFIIAGATIVMPFMLIAYIIVTIWRICNGQRY